MPAVPAAGEQEGAVASGQAGQADCQQRPLRQKGREGLRAPEDYLGCGEDERAQYDGAPVPQPVGQPPPGQFQKEHQRQGEAFDPSDLYQIQTALLPVKGGHRTVKDLSLIHI